MTLSFQSKDSKDQKCLQEKINFDELDSSDYSISKKILASDRGSEISDYSSSNFSQQSQIRLNNTKQIISFQEWKQRQDNEFETQYVQIVNRQQLRSCQEAEIGDILLYSKSSVDEDDSSKLDKVRVSNSHKSQKKLENYLEQTTEPQHRLVRSPDTSTKTLSKASGTPIQSAMETLSTLRKSHDMMVGAFSENHLPQQSQRTTHRLGIAEDARENDYYSILEEEQKEDEDQISNNEEQSQQLQIVYQSNQGNLLEPPSVETQSESVSQVYEGESSTNHHSIESLQEDTESLQIELKSHSPRRQIEQSCEQKRGQFESSNKFQSEESEEAIVSSRETFNETQDTKEEEKQAGVSDIPALHHKQHSCNSFDSYTAKSGVNSNQSKNQGIVLASSTARAAVSSFTNQSLSCSPGLPKGIFEDSKPLEYRCPSPHSGVKQTGAPTQILVENLTTMKSSPQQLARNNEYISHEVNNCSSSDSSRDKTSFNDEHFSQLPSLTSFRAQTTISSRQQVIEQAAENAANCDLFEEGEEPLEFLSDEDSALIRPSQLEDRIPTKNDHTTIYEENESQYGDEDDTPCSESKISSSCSSPSLVFSQTNQDRITLQSVMYNQESAFVNQMTSRTSTRKSFTGVGTGTNKKYRQKITSSSKKAIECKGLGFYGQNSNQLQKDLAQSFSSASQQPCSTARDRFISLHDQQIVSGFNATVSLNDLNKNNMRSSLDEKPFGDTIGTTKTVEYTNMTNNHLHNLEKQRISQMNFEEAKRVAQLPKQKQQPYQILSKLGDATPHVGVQDFRSGDTLSPYLQAHLTNQSNQMKVQKDQQVTLQHLPTDTKQSITEINFQSELYNPNNFTSRQTDAPTAPIIDDHGDFYICRQAASVKKNLNLLAAFQEEKLIQENKEFKTFRSAEPEDFKRVLDQPSQGQGEPTASARNPLSQSSEREKFYIDPNTFASRRSKNSVRSSVKDNVVCKMSVGSQCDDVNKSYTFQAPLSKIADLSHQESSPSNPEKQKDQTLISSDQKQIATVSEANAFLEEFLTEEDVAVFRSQPNDVPDHLQPSKRLLKPRPLESPRRFFFEWEESDPRSLQNTQAISMSTLENLEDDHLSPKFEKLVDLQKLPSFAEHSGMQHSASKSFQITQLQSPDGLSPFDDKRQSIKVSKQSFLSRVVKRKKSGSVTDTVTPTQNNIERKRSRNNQSQSATGNYTSSTDLIQNQSATVPTSKNLLPPMVDQSCHTITHLQKKNKQLSMWSQMQSVNDFDAGQTHKYQQSIPQVPSDLKAFLSSLSLASYGPLLVEQGLDDLQALVRMMGKNRVLPLTHSILDEAGIKLPGHRAKILVYLELMAGVFEENSELCSFLDKRLITQGPLKSCKSAENVSLQEHVKSMMINQIQSPVTENTLNPSSLQQMLKQSVESCQQLSLQTWLQNQNLLFLHPCFVRSGFDCLQALSLQAYSTLNPLTDNVLLTQIGISKMGHRHRILSQLRQDALQLPLFQQIGGVHQSGHLSSTQAMTPIQGSWQNTKSLSPETDVQTLAFKNSISKRASDESPPLLMSQYSPISRPKANKLRLHGGISCVSQMKQSRDTSANSSNCDFGLNKHSRYFQGANKSVRTEQQIVNRPQRRQGSTDYINQTQDQSCNIF